jgi:hypothetical protein
VAWERIPVARGRIPRHFSRYFQQFVFSILLRVVQYGFQQFAQQYAHDFARRDAYSHQVFAGNGEVFN